MITRAFAAPAVLGPPAHRWHLVTGEYPPDCGGVGDYSYQLAHALVAAGDDVHVWAPSQSLPARNGPVVHQLPDEFGADSRLALSRALETSPGTLLLQYVPNALGRRGANVSFCRWLLGAARSGADVRIMFHEPYFYFGLQRPWRNVLAIAQRGMAALLLRSASAVYVSSDSWRRCLEPYGPMEQAVTLPIFATVPEHRGTVADVKRRWIGDSPSPLIGHFGTFGDHVSRALQQVLPRVLSTSPSARVLLIGRNSERFAAQWRATARSSPERVLAAGALEPAAIAAALQACDVVLQPYPDGVTTRRTSVMAALRNGCPTVTTEGRLTEDVWRATRAAVLVRHGDAGAFADACAALLADAGARQTAAFRARAAYRAHFSIEHTIGRLRGAADAQVAVR